MQKALKCVQCESLLSLEFQFMFCLFENRNCEQLDDFTSDRTCVLAFLFYLFFCLKMLNKSVSLWFCDYQHNNLVDDIGIEEPYGFCFLLLSVWHLPLISTWMMSMCSLVLGGCFFFIFFCWKNFEIFLCLIQHFSGNYHH